MTIEQITVRNFMLKKFPTNKYMDCPVPKHHWEVIQEYAEQYANQKLAALQTMTPEQLKEESERLYPTGSQLDFYQRAAYIAGASAHGNGEEIFPGFWNRLLLFVENIQVNDAMSEEEKEIIINCAKAQQAVAPVLQQK